MKSKSALRNSYNHTRNSIPVNQFTPTADFTSAQLSEGRPQEVWSPNCVVLKWFLFSTCVLNKFRHGWTQVHSDGYLSAHSWLYAPPCQNEHAMPCFRNDRPYLSRRKHFSSVKKPSKRLKGLTSLLPKKMLRGQWDAWEEWALAAQAWRFKFDP